MGKLLSFVLGVTAALWILPGVQVDHSAWHIASYKAGREDALSLNPVSWDLDAAPCGSASWDRNEFTRRCLLVHRLVGTELKTKATTPSGGTVGVWGKEKNT
jgi:hypothetical protein